MRSRVSPSVTGLTLVEVIAATVLLAMVAVTVTPALRGGGPGDEAIARAETWLRTRLADAGRATVSPPAGLQWRQRPLPRQLATGDALPGTASAWVLIEVLDVRGRVLAWRVLPQDGAQP